jgi:hypothetical protein
MKKLFLLIFILALLVENGISQTKQEKKWVRQQMASLSLNEKIAQLMIVRAHSNWDQKKRDTLSELIKKFNIGGLCFFQGGPIREALQTNYYQSIAKTPMFISMDAEWGLGMRLDSVDMFPRQLSLGAIPSSSLIYQMGVAVAAQCKRMGIQINYAPDVDINNNPSNPVINDRSFGQNKERVIQHGIAYMQGLQDNNVMATAKHFPGHGDVAVDSHVDLPIINKSRAALDSLELAPFRALIDAGVGSVMVGHLYVPSIDSTPKTPTSLSGKAIHDLLKKELGFKGIAVTDALDMKAIGNYFPNGEANVQALLAGNDLLCLPGDIEQSIKKISTAIREGRLSRKDINQRVKKVLTAKYKYGLSQISPIDTNNLLADLNKSVGSIKTAMALQSLTFVKANAGLPYLSQNKKIAYLALNLTGANTLTKALEENYQAKIFYVNAKDSNDLANLKTSLSLFDQVIVGLHNYNKRPANRFEIPSCIINLLNETQDKHWIHLIFGNPYAVANFKGIDNILFAYEDNLYTQKAALQWLEGKLQATGQLPVTVSDSLLFGATNKNPTAATNHEKLDNGKQLAFIDSMVMDAIEKKAIPGCQILVAKNNNIIFNKAYGHLAGVGSPAVDLETVYDLASVTKVSATTVSIMRLLEEGKLRLDNTIGDYLPWVRGNEKEKITIKDLLLHQAGLYPYIKFYESLLEKDGQFKPGLVTQVADNTHHQMITPSKYLLDSWEDSIRNKILESPISTPGKYIYSDNDFIFLGLIVEKISDMSLNEFATQNFYGPLGMKATGFLPLQKTGIDKIAASEIDNYYRHELVQGAVHDEGASVMGGIAGHAGLFSNTTDLAKMYLMLLNKGQWEGQTYFNANTVNLFTSYQTDNSRRGLGFDKPEKNNASSKDPYPCLSASPSTFGHTGFTGTCVWADPEKQLLFIFLSNRVYPTRDSKAFNALSLRTKIQEGIYAILN